MSQMVSCPECARLAAEAERIRKKYQAALIRLHAALDTIKKSTLKFEKLKAEADDLGRQYSNARRAFEKHRRTHLKLVRCP
jgi:capsule polysaccharide export protein KpsE/RkpR